MQDNNGGTESRLQTIPGGYPERKATFVADQERTLNAAHVLLIATGSVASIKIPLIVEELLKYPRIQVQIVASSSSLHFFPSEAVEELSDASRRIRVFTDADEWQTWNRVGDPILHIELRRWADLVLVVPCSANTLAKIAGGMCDNLATSVLRALDPSTPTYLFPAMNTLMYNHPLTAVHLKTIKDVIGYNVVGPIGKNLACGDIGVGAMTEWRDIVHLVLEHFSLADAPVAEDVARRSIERKEGESN